MSQLLFDRKIRVVIGRLDGSAFEVADLRMAFKVKKFDGSKPNTAEIKIWNLSRQSAERTRAPDSFVQIFAGYGEVVPLLFLGAVTRSSTIKEGMDRITTIESGRGLGAPGTISKTFRGQQDLKKVLKETAGPLGALAVDLSLVPDVPVSSSRSITVSGSPERELNRLSASNGLDWFVDDGVLRFVPRDQPVQKEAIVLTPRSGLIGSPRPVQKKGENKGRASVEFESLLKATLRPRRIVALDDVDEMSGWYLMRAVEYTGDLWGEFRNKIEATPIEARA